MGSCEKLEKIIGQLVVVVVVVVVVAAKKVAIGECKSVYLIQDVYVCNHMCRLLEKIIFCRMLIFWSAHQIAYQIASNETHQIG